MRALQPLWQWVTTNVGSDRAQKPVRSAAPFAEAFADWYAVIVVTSEGPTWRAHLEDNFHHKNCQQGASKPGGGTFTCQDDGSVVQGAVHSFLWDLTDDSQSEPHDPLRFPPLRIAEAVKECHVQMPGRIRPEMAYRGIDHLIFCMEERSPYRVNRDPTGIVDFFNSRPSTERPKTTLGGVVAPKDDQFRRLWLVNLYSKRVDDSPKPGPLADEPPTDEPPGDAPPTCEPQGTAQPIDCP